MSHNSFEGCHGTSHCQAGRPVGCPIIALGLSWDIPLSGKKTSGMSHNSFGAVMGHPIVKKKSIRCTMM